MMSCMLCGAGAFANETAPRAGKFTDGKFYVTPGTVHVGANGIFLNLEENFIPVNAVCMDEYGGYVLGYNAVYVVECPRCGVEYDADNQSSKCPHGWKVHYSAS